jgi:hypothetical protein
MIVISPKTSEQTGKINAPAPTPLTSVCSELLVARSRSQELDLLPELFNLVLCHFFYVSCPTFTINLLS